MHSIFRIFITLSTRIMMRYFLGCCLLLFISTSALFCQQTNQALLDSREVPFEMVKNAIIVPVKINGISYRFVLDTGGVFMISRKLQEQGNFVVTDSISISDINKQEQVFEKVLIEEASIGELSLKDREAIVLFDNQSYPNSCFETDGMIGRDFFGGMILQFDYDNKVIRLTEDESVFDLDQEHRTKMKISERGIADVLLNINGKNQYIEFDSGSGDFFSYQAKKAKRLRVKSKADKLEYEGIFSFGVSSSNLIESSTRYKAKVYNLTMGSTTFENFYSDFTKPTAPRIGASILYHGKVTVDYKNLWFYFEPYPTQFKPTTLSTFGFDIVYLQEQYLIKWVLKGSVAEQEGLKFGLKIKSIDGTPIAEIIKGCETYINGYAFQEKESVVLEYYDPKGTLKTMTLHKTQYE